MSDIQKINRRKAKDQANRLWKLLDEKQRWDLGDNLVWGSFAWDDWFEEKMIPGVLRELDRIMMLWEQTQ